MLELDPVLVLVWLELATSTVEAGVLITMV
jgi:hypothetical protein